MRLRFKAHIVSFLLGCSGAAFSQVSWADLKTADCNNSETFVEKTICSNPKLTALDNDLSVQVEAAFQVNKVPQKLLEFSHDEWLMRRNKCKNTACIEDAYQSRLDDIKQYNATNQSFVKYYLRKDLDNLDSNALAILEVHKLDEKRIRIIAKTYLIDKTDNKSQVIAFSGYSNQAKRMLVKDLDSKCHLKIRMSKQQLEVRQASNSCGNKQLRFSGHYDQQL